VDGSDRSAVATFFVAAAFAPGATATLDESAAHHARVKRLEAGDPVRLTNGAGSLGSGTIAAVKRGEVLVDVLSVESLERPAALHLRVPVADRDRMLWLAEKATELGVASWQAVRFRRSLSVSPRGEGDGFRAKILARMTSALEQSGGAWLPEMLPEVDVESLSAPNDTLPVVLDVAGPPLISAMADAPNRFAPILLVGPEGGIEQSELASLTSRGWRTASLGATTLRFETAGIAAIAVMRALLQREKE
jgi:16S rRNA (uracil1498-N3)-methyltransferase